MPLPGYGNLTSSEGFTAGAAHTRLRGPALSGQLADNASGGPNYAPGGYMCVQSTAGALTQVISTGATERGSYVFIPVSTATFVTSGGSATAPPYGAGVGAAIAWDDAAKRIMIFSSGSSGWLRMPAAGAFTSS